MNQRMIRIILSIVILSMFLFPQVIFTVAIFLLAYDVFMGIVTSKTVTQRLMKPTLGRFLSWCWRTLKSAFGSTKDSAIVVYKKQQYKRSVDPSKDTINL